MSLGDHAFDTLAYLIDQEIEEIFAFTDVPYGVALENGRLKAAVTVFDAADPDQTLRKLGFVK